MTWHRTVRGRITILATVVVAVVLGLASAAVLQLVESNVRTAAAEAVAESLAAAAQGGSDPSGTIRVDGASFEFGVFERSGELAFGILSIGGVEAAQVELNLTTGEVNELFDPRTGETLDDPALRSEVAELALVFTDLDDTRVLVDAPSPDDIDISLSAVARALWVIVPLVMLLTAFLAWLLAGQALRPVSRLVDEVDTIHGANLASRLRVPEGGDEVSRLAATMNDMLGRLDASDRRQRQFTADASHELRSPLATIRANAELLGDEADPDVASKRGRAIVSAADRMDSLMDRLLELARSEAVGDAPTDDVDPAALLAEVATGFVGVEVAAAESVRVLGHEDDLRRLFTNLVDNATRHASGRVVVTVAADPPTVTVDDDGPGIAPADRDAVFERFGRISESRSRADGGAGLGLAIAGAIAAAHGASITIAEAPIGGARFTVEFQRATNA